MPGRCAQNFPGGHAVQSIIVRLKAQYLKRCIAVCDATCDSLTRKLETEGLTVAERFAIVEDLSQALRDRNILLLTLDLLERKENESS